LSHIVQPEFDCILSLDWYMTYTRSNSLHDSVSDIVVYMDRCSMAHQIFGLKLWKYTKVLINGLLVTTMLYTYTFSYSNCCSNSVLDS